ncbi:transposase, IS605 OrfB family [Gloeocapsa sp. PCC 7428]|uniref:IS200/IS605 family element transposase accessory protein TnpB n=1 Tax=Gloeocapsa sp. PCC 7428 TaxID=1173026 RepID=UPI0002A5FC0A|nr:IS200/IS605 family element transposase accessory protein TnpB [Gloeocapsa sp. PCC 7428]AFZ29590.1 transposase, IS605 OrfB family [Gloeocapsa sp. PCC 7428]
MTQKTSYKKIIRTDKWKLSPTREQKELMLLTVKEYRRLCRFLVTVVSTHWVELGGLKSDQVVPAVEKLVHATSKNTKPKYPQFNKSFHKFPSYLRRAAIMFAVGQVSSYMTRYYEWQSGIRKRRDAKPPVLNPDTGCYPSLYKGQCYKLHEFKIVEIKVFTGSDWIWISVPIISLRERHQVETNQIKSPSLIVSSKQGHLSVPFECNPEKITKSGVVLAVDLGINTTATVSVVSQEGTVIYREFIHPGRDIDRRDKRLKSISMKAKKTKKLSCGFCKHTYRKCRNINQQIGHIVSKRIVNIAKSFKTEAIVFENLKNWKPKGGKKRSNLKQRFHGWLKSLIFTLTQNKWIELGGKIISVIAAYTSKLAFDGSGFLKRDSKNYTLATFNTGKHYNCDLNGSYNIAARGWQKLTERKYREERGSKSSTRSPRSWACLCDLWFSTQIA